MSKVFGLDFTASRLQFLILQSWSQVLGMFAADDFTASLKTETAQACLSLSPLSMLMKISEKKTNNNNIDNSFRIVTFQELMILRASFKD